MKELSRLRAPKGANKADKRKGRGPGSGLGQTGGRGEKGQRARSGYGQRPGFEGGQMPLQRRVPKFGFKKPFRVEFAVVNVEDLNRFDNGTVVNPDTLRAAGLVKGRKPVKVLGTGELKKNLVVQAHRFSKTASEKIGANGGKAEVLEA